MATTRTAAYIDGYNLFHALDGLNSPHLKWLDLWSLAESLLRPNDVLTAVKYFSAYATWMSEAYATHRAYVSALEATGVAVVMGRFKRLQVTCKKCRQSFLSAEEKRTDVNIALALVVDCLQDGFDRAILVSADTDLIPAIEEVRRLAPKKEVFVAVPPRRYKMAREFGKRYELKPGRLAQHLLASAYRDAAGNLIATRPPKYAPKP